MPLAQPCAASRELHTEIGSALRSAATLTVLIDATKRLRDKPDLIRSRLCHLLDHPDRLREIAAQSYVHSNGFAKVKMVEGHDFCVRLHIWPPGEDRLGDVDPHGHRWEFASWVAVGPGMSETHFVEATATDPDATGYEKFDYGRADGAGYLQACGAAWLRPSDHRVRPPGTVYGCSRRILHTVAPVGVDLVATVVLQGPVLTESAPVYRRPDRTPDALERPITPDELGHLFGGVVAAIGASESR